MCHAPKEMERYDKGKSKKGLVKKLREIRHQFNKDLEGMTLDEEREYLEKMTAQWKDAPRA